MNKTYIETNHFLINKLAYLKDIKIVEKNSSTSLHYKNCFYVRQGAEMKFLIAKKYVKNHL